MQIPVLIEPLSGHGYRAKAGELLPVSAEGATPEEAVHNLRAAMDRQLKKLANNSGRWSLVRIIPGLHWQECTTLRIP